MHYTFENHCEFPENSVGKLILCKEGTRVMLFGRMVALDEIASLTWEAAKERLKDIMHEKDPERGIARIRVIAGDHREIPHRASVLGGTQAVYRDRRIFLLRDSARYGGVHPDAVQQCIPHVAVEHESLGGFSDYRDPLEIFLAYEGER